MLSLFSFNSNRFHKKLKTTVLNAFPGTLRFFQILVFVCIFCFFIHEVSFRPTDVHRSVRRSAKHLLNIDNDLFQEGKYDDAERLDIMSDDETAQELMKDQPKSVDEVLERYRLLNGLKNKEATVETAHEQRPELRAEAAPSNIHQWSDMFKIEDDQDPAHHFGAEEDIDAQENTKFLKTYIKKNSAQFPELAEGQTATTLASLAAQAMKKVIRRSSRVSIQINAEAASQNRPQQMTSTENSADMKTEVKKPARLDPRLAYRRQILEQHERRKAEEAAKLAYLDKSQTANTDEQAAESTTVVSSQDVPTLQPQDSVATDVTPQEKISSSRENTELSVTSSAGKVEVAPKTETLETSEHTKAQEIKSTGKISEAENKKTVSGKTVAATRKAETFESAKQKTTNKKSVKVEKDFAKESKTTSNKDRKDEDSLKKQDGAEKSTSETEKTSFKELKTPFRGVNLGIVRGVNVTRLSYGLYSLIKKYKVNSLVDFSCYKNSHWMPQTLERLQKENPKFEFHCLENSSRAMFMDEAKKQYVKPKANFQLLHLGNGKDAYPNADMYFSWRAFHDVGAGGSWQILKSMRQNNVKYIAFGNNRGCENDMSVTSENEVLNVIRAPFFLGAPLKVISNLTTTGWPYSAPQQLIFYDIDSLRPGIL